MTLRHDEIVKALGDGWAVAWDTNDVDAKTVKQIAKVAEEQAAELSRIFEADVVMRAGDTLVIAEAKTRQEPPAAGEGSAGPRQLA